MTREDQGPPLEDFVLPAYRVPRSAHAGEWYGDLMILYPELEGCDNEGNPRDRDPSDTRPDLDAPRWWANLDRAIAAYLDKIENVRRFREYPGFAGDEALATLHYLARGIVEAWKHPSSGDRFGERGRADLYLQIARMVACLNSDRSITLDEFTDGAIPGFFRDVRGEFPKAVPIKTGRPPDPSIPARDEWIRAKRKEGWPRKKIHSELKKIVKKKGWPMISESRISQITGSVN